jgi:CRP/FNR family cyclic AMP-dependent transcriptional regulator
VLASNEVDYLRGLSVFAGLPSEIVETIGKYARRVDTDGREVLLDEGAPAKEMLVVLEGELVVFKRCKRGAEACIARLGPGAVVGEMSLVDIKPRSAGVRSAGPASVAVLSHGDIAKIYREDQQSYTLFLLNIAREISLRLRKLDDLLADLVCELEAVTGPRSSDRHLSEP